LQEKTAQNRLANDAALKAWILKHTPAEIHRANLARRKLKTQYGKSLRFLKDDRIPKRPAAPYMLFIKSKYQTGEDIGVNAETSRKIVAEWKALSPAERQVCLLSLFRPRRSGPAAQLYHIEHTGLLVRIYSPSSKITISTGYDTSSRSRKCLAKSSCLNENTWTSLVAGYLCRWWLPLYETQSVGEHS